MDKNIETNKFNKKQLDVISDCLKEAFKYQESIQDLDQLKIIPRTWSDLNKYTMFI